MPILDNAKHEAFAQEYLVDKNATQAAIRAGYSKRSAHVTGARLLRNDKVAARIHELQSERAERIEIDQDEVMRRLKAIVLADPNELIQHRVGSCRYCHGKGYKFQWRTEREFKDALRDYQLLSDPAKVLTEKPNNAGGYGYKRTEAPNPECPECEGEGIGYTRVMDTTRLSNEAQMLFSSIKTTQHGIEVKTHDRMKALIQIGEHLGMFKGKTETAVNNLAQALQEIASNGSKAPIASSPGAVPKPAPSAAPIATADDNDDDEDDE